MESIRNVVVAAIIAVFIVTAAMTAENNLIADVDLRHAVTLITGVLAGILAVLFSTRIAFLMLKNKILAVAPHLYVPIRNLARVSFVTVMSLIGCLFIVAHMKNKSGAVNYRLMFTVVIFGAVALYGLNYMWRVWRTYRRLRGGNS